MRKSTTKAKARSGAGVMFSKVVGAANTIAWLIGWATIVVWSVPRLSDILAGVKTAGEAVGKIAK